jgi:hypothetical protein
MSRRTCDIQNGDEKWVEEFEHQIDMLCGMVHEMMVEDKVMLLSPVMRELLIEKAKLVLEKARLVRRRIVIDNLGPPLSEATK